MDYLLGTCCVRHALLGLETVTMLKFLKEVLVSAPRPFSFLEPTIYYGGSFEGFIVVQCFEV